MIVDSQPSRRGPTAADGVVLAADYVLTGPESPSQAGPVEHQAVDDGASDRFERDGGKPTAPGSRTSGSFAAWGATIGRPPFITSTVFDILGSVEGLLGLSRETACGADCDMLHSGRRAAPLALAAPWPSEPRPGRRRPTVSSSGPATVSPGMLIDRPHRCAGDLVGARPRMADRPGGQATALRKTLVAQNTTTAHSGMVTAKACQTWSSVSVPAVRAREPSTT